jgi:hypothetical protein
MRRVASSIAPIGEPTWNQTRRLAALVKRGQVEWGTNGYQEATFCGSYAETEAVKVPRALMERLTDAVCYAA